MSVASSDLVIGRTLGKMLVDAGVLPSNVQSANISIPKTGAATIQMTQLITKEQSQKIVQVLKRYHLVERRDLPTKERPLDIRATRNAAAPDLQENSQ